MLDRNAILRKLTNLEFPKKQFWVCSGAALVLYGVKPFTHDIDLGVTSELLENLLQQGLSLRLSKLDGTRMVDLDEEVEALENWGIASEKVLMEGVQVVSLQSIRKQKEELGREKDLKDLSLIDEFLQKR